MKKQTNRGGARPRSGRKPVEDPKEGLTVYIQKSIIEANGGRDECRDAVIEFLTKAAKRRKG
jgi:hypothetical protein